MNRILMTGATALSAIVAGASAQNIEVTFENLLPADATAFTPVFLGVHDGGFDLFDPDSAVSAGLEEVAEVGSTGTLTGEFNASGSAIDSATTMGGPVLGGQSRTQSFDLTAVGGDAFLTFATMVVPTNDLFIGNGNPTGIRLLNADGSFAGPVTVDIFAGQVWDAGTEVNNADDGAAFLAGIVGSAGTVEGGVASLFVSDPNYIAYLDSLVGRETAPGFILNQTFSENDLIARVTIVPAPGVGTLAAFGALATIRRRC